VLDLESVDAAGALSLMDANDKIPDPPAALERLVDRIDHDREWWITLQMADTSIVTDPSPEPRAIARLVETAQRIRAPG
jgi:hypothetical protein